jgi:hypothetical protein
MIHTANETTTEVSIQDREDDYQWQVRGESEEPA